MTPELSKLFDELVARLGAAGLAASKGPHQSRGCEGVGHEGGDDFPMTVPHTR